MGQVFIEFVCFSLGGRFQRSGRSRSKRHDKLMVVFEKNWDETDEEGLLRRVNQIFCHENQQVRILMIGECHEQCWAWR